MTMTGEEGHGTLDRDDEEGYFDDESAEVVISSLRLGDQGSSKSLSAYRNKLQSPTISSPFVLRTEDRAAKGKQKLEEKFNEKEAQVQQQTKLKGKAETELRRLRQSFCFKARPLPNFYKGRETPKNKIKKVSLSSLLGTD